MSLVELFSTCVDDLDGENYYNGRLTEVNHPQDVELLRTERIPERQVASWAVLARVKYENLFR